MAATAATFSDQQLESELQQLQKEISSGQEKLQEAQRRLGAAQSDRSRIVEGIARSTVKDSELSRIKADIEVLEIKVEGLNGILASNRSRYSTIQEELARRAETARIAARQKGRAELETRGQAAAMRISEKLARIISEDIAEFDAIRQTLGRDFGDMGGIAAAQQLRELVFRPTRGSEPLRDPNVHITVLQSRGWVFADEPGPSRKFIKTEQGAAVGTLVVPNVYEVIPGGALELTVVSMRSQR